MFMSENIYLIRCQDFYKIGIAADPQARVSTIQSGNPNPVFLVASVKTPYARAIECTLHAVLHEVRERGEWFRLPRGVEPAFSDLIKACEDQILAACSAVCSDALQQSFSRPVPVSEPPHHLADPNLREDVLRVLKSGLESPPSPCFVLGDYFYVHGPALRLDRKRLSVLASLSEPGRVQHKGINYRRIPLALLA